MVNVSSLGASLYVPTTRQDLQKIADGEVLSHLRSVIFCTEDAVSEADLSYALFNLSLMLQQMSDRPSLARFVRVRNPFVMKRILNMPGSDKLDGFVLPKVTSNNFDAYFQQVCNTKHKLMQTLETIVVFNELEMLKFRQCLEHSDVRDRILALRIGGNDLLALLGIRRPRNMTIYRTPLGPVISRLVTIFRPYGFVLTAPVFEHLDNSVLLLQEVEEDLAHGMVGKTAIHPSQVELIEQHYRVKHNDLEVALKVIDKTSPSVFRMHDSMCEVATHNAWASNLIERARIFGTHVGNGGD